MPSNQRSSVNLGLAATPEVTDPKLFPVFLDIYNALNILAQSLDSYTGDGTLGAQLTELNSKVTAVNKVLSSNALENTMLYIKDATLIAAGVAAIQGTAVDAAKKRVITSMIAVNTTAAAIILLVYNVPAGGAANATTEVLKYSVAIDETFDCVKLKGVGINSGGAIWASGAGLSFSYTATEYPNT